MWSIGSSLKGIIYRKEGKMKPGKKTGELMNVQVTQEFLAAYKYFGMAAYFDSQSLQGFAHWMKVQAQEELSHAMKFYEHLHDRGSTVSLGSIEKQETNFASALAAVQEALAHEQRVTILINAIAEASEQEKDYPSRNFIGWFIAEQVEEESSAYLLIEQVKMVGESKPSLLMLDRKLAKRE